MVEDDNDDNGTCDLSARDNNNILTRNGRERARMTNYRKRGRRALGKIGVTGTMRHYNKPVKTCKIFCFL